MKNVIMVIHNLNFNNGGITKVMMNRSHFFNDLGYKVNIATFDAEQDYIILEKKFKECGRLHEKSKIINFYDYFLNKNYSKEVSPTQYDPELEVDEHKYLTQKTYLKTKGFVRYFNESGILIKCKYWVNDLLSKVDYYKENHVYLSKLYKNNSLFQIINYDKDGKDILSRFFTPDGFCYFQRSFLEQDLLHLFVFNRKEKSVIGFNSYSKLHTYFLEQLCTEENSYDNIVICDGPGSAEKVANISDKKAKKILTIHSNHFSSPYTIGSKIKDGIKITLDNIEKVNHVIVLTPSQLQDLTTQFGYKDKFFYIPNTINKPSDFNKIAFTSHNKKKINIVSRYVSMKHHEHVIQAINKISDKISPGELEVNFYGEGPEKLNLQNIVKSLHLDKIININDYITDVDLVFKEADLTVFTSSYEGFGLTIIEAMANKTPVISYNINYGPRDIISHGEDGYLVSYGDIENLSKKIYQILFEDINILNNFSNNAFQKVNENFTHKFARNEWKKIIEN